MEYALDGYGFSIPRVVRSMRAQQQGADETRGPPPPDEFLSLFDGESFPQSLLETLVRTFLQNQHATFEPPLELLSTLRSLRGREPMDGLMLRVASATKAAFDAIRRSLKLRIAACSIEEGEHGDKHMLLGVYAPELSADVRVDDLVTAGVLVALHAENDGARCRLEILPRIYRKVCQNGTIVFAENAPARELDPSRRPDIGAMEPLVAEFERMIRDCFDAKAFESTVNRFRQSAQEQVDVGTLVNTTRAGLSPEVEQAVLARYMRSRDFTRWGFLNAITAEARTASSALMLKLERLGGSVARSAVVGERPTREVSEVDLAGMIWPKADTAGATKLPLQRSKKSAAA